LSYNFFYKKLDQLARRMFPGLVDKPDMNWDHLISPLELRLPKKVLQNATRAITALHALSRRPEYARLLEPVPGISDAPVKYESALMAYDFHTNEAGDCSLVEINTNAAGYLLASLMEMTHRGVEPADYAPLKSLQESFVSELQLAGKPTAGARVAITDEDIPQQKMYGEFLMYRDWFRQSGWPAEFCEASDFRMAGDELQTAADQGVDLVYNRLTDFYLEQPAHAALREGFTRGLACITPNPREYWLLADKQRLIQMTEPGFLESAGASAEEIEAIRAVLIPTFEKSAFASTDEIWHQRKRLFFKPKRSHGGKSVYRGESVSRKVFERLIQEDILIQHFTPAQKVPTDDPRSVLNNWKFDLRFYVYADKIQLCAARIYQGQVTNFSSPLGGFTTVQF
jgi:hypothetical protein